MAKATQTNLRALLKARPQGCRQATAEPASRLQTERPEFRRFYGVDSESSDPM